jgi:hypothetical protein
MIFTSGESEAASAANGDSQQLNMVSRMARARGEEWVKEVK